MRSIFYWPGTRRKKERKAQVEYLRKCAEPPICRYCGIKSYFHYCEVLAQQWKDEMK